MLLGRAEGGCNRAQGLQSGYGIPETEHVKPALLASLESAEVEAGDNEQPQRGAPYHTPPHKQQRTLPPTLHGSAQPGLSAAIGGCAVSGLGGKINSTRQASLATLMRHTLLFLAIHAASFASSATTLAPIELAELVRSADIVATVQVVSGEVIGSGGETCGAKYRATVEEAFKGTSNGATIEFGNYFGYEVGSRYVLLLVGPGRTYEPMLSTNSMQQEAKAQFLAKCAAKLSRPAVMHSGNGALRIRWTQELQYKDGVLVPTRYVVLPAGTKTYSAMVGESEQFSGVVSVKVEDFAELLRKLAR